MSEGEAYLDIVWRQFRKRRAAVGALWVLAFLGLVAIFAPLLASDVPLVFHDGETTIYPWYHALLNPSQPQDLLFNMALVGFIPWVALALVTNWWTRRRGVPRRRRIGWVAAEFAAIVLLLVGVFSLVPSVHPSNEYWSRNFPKEEQQSPETKHGVYVPLSYGPAEKDLDVIIEQPGFRKQEHLQQVNQSTIHWLGTSNGGQDVLAQMIYGTRVSMTVGFVAVGIYVSIGVVLGSIAGYFGGMVDIVISRIIEIVLLFPAFFLILTLVALIGPNVYIIMVVIGITGWPSVARLVRGEVLKQRSLDYTLAAQALGAAHGRIVFRHILPNALSPVFVAVPFGIASAVIIEASLSLLGFGVKPPAPSWGQLLNVATSNYHNWWLIVFPSIAIFVTVTVFNLIGNALRDAMDPRLRI